MKKLSLILLFNLIITATSEAQTLKPCYFDDYKNKHKSFILDAEQVIQTALKNNITSKRNGLHNPNLSIIPVVVHIIHGGGAENISDSQIFSQILVLNEDFRKLPGTNGHGKGVDTDIEFCLASKDPYGRCTNGIIRIESTLTDHQTYQRSELKKLSFWDNSRYLNIYIVKDINNGSGTLGYSSFPGGPAAEDGIVVRHNYFGTSGTASGGVGRTTTHEVGHWLGLYHTFNGGCGTDTCTDGDFVCDTPPVANPNFGCPSGVNSCNNDSQPDLIENYMDYSSGSCQNMFTTGQKSRMVATLSSIRKDISSQWNIDSTGCDSGFVNGPCKAIADFVTLTPDICAGSTILFNSKIQNTPSTIQWYFQGGIPSMSSLPNPKVTYPVTGSYNVKQVVSNSFGSDSLTLQNYVRVATPVSGQKLPFYEGFETPVFPPNNIILENPDNGITWELDNNAVAYQGNGSAKINNLINTNYGQSDAMILPDLDFTTISGNPFLFFKWAYAKSDINYSDELIVLASKDCGVTWDQIFYRTGNGLSTAPVQTTPYIPDASTVWKSASIDLGVYTSSKNVQLKLVNVTDGGNSLYIDNISVGMFPLNIDGTVPDKNRFVIYPSPTNDIIKINNNQGSIYAEVKIVNTMGLVVKSDFLYLHEVSEIDVSKLNPGLYTIIISIERSSVEVKRILIQ